MTYIPVTSLQLITWLVGAPVEFLTHLYGFVGVPSDQAFFLSACISFQAVIRTTTARRGVDQLFGEAFHVDDGDGVMVVW